VRRGGESPFLKGSTMKNFEVRYDLKMKDRKYSWKKLRTKAVDIQDAFQNYRGFCAENNLTVDMACDVIEIK
jgi:hypothetical protein